VHKEEKCFFIDASLNSEKLTSDKLIICKIIMAWQLEETLTLREKRKPDV
jgi:hypothetical protein